MSHDNEAGSKKIYFEPSTLETIDRSVNSFLKDLNLFTMTNKGARQVPVVWASEKKAILAKKRKESRDDQGTLVYPLISIRRGEVKKALKSLGVFQGNVPGVDDEQGGSLEVSRVIYQEKSMQFANADALRLHGQSNYPRPNPKVVYKTVSAPMPVNIQITYEINIRTEYQQQMNELMQPFITKFGTVNFVSLSEGQHKFEGFIDETYSDSTNLADFSSEERKFESKISLRVIGYLVGEGNNREQAHYSVRENIVEVKIPRERLSLQEVPEHEYGRYYGLEGLPMSGMSDSHPFSKFFSNVPAVRGGGSDSGVSNQSVAGDGSVVTQANFSEILSQNMVVREVLKADDAAVPSPANQLTISGATVRTNTETLFINGLVQSVGTGNDYTISGNVITLSFNLQGSDSVYVTYIKQ